MATVRVAREGGGLREQNKREKLARIIAAARDLFGRHGIEATTLREVATAARVGAGTLFLYAHTKEDLLVLVFLAELQPVIDAGFRDLPEGDLLSRLLHSFAPIVEHHARNLRLSRPFLRDVQWVSDVHAPTITDFVTSWNQRVIGLIDAAKRRGEIRADVDSALLASCARQLFLAQLRNWVSGRSSRADFDRTLPAGLKLLLAGLGP
jgi:AcrR family transcriptional regulator